MTTGCCAASSELARTGSTPQTASPKPGKPLQRRRPPSRWKTHPPTAAQDMDVEGKAPGVARRAETAGTAQAVAAMGLDKGSTTELVLTSNNSHMSMYPLSL
jgi:hypothetical protein